MVEVEDQSKYNVQELIGKKITVHIAIGPTYLQVIGVLESFDGITLKVRKSESEVFYYPIHSVSFVKPF